MNQNGSFAVIVGVMALARFFRPAWQHENLYLRIRSNGNGHAAAGDLEGMIGTLVDHCSLVKLKRHDQTGDMTETSFLVEFRHLENLTQAKKELNERFSPLEVSFIDNEGLI